MTAKPLPTWSFPGWARPADTAMTAGSVRGRALLVTAGLGATIYILAYSAQSSGWCPPGPALLLKTRLRADGWELRGQAAEGQVRRRPAACPDPQEVRASPWAQSCHLVTKVCVDRGTLVLYDDRYQPAPAGGGEAAPTFAAEQNYGQFIYFYRNGHGEYMYPLDSIRSRAVGMDEGAEYLRRPVFSNCTVPVVWYSFWMTNFGHFFRDNAAKLYGFIGDTPWAESLKLVSVTAEGLALPSFNTALLQTMSALRVETWADFSSRLLPGSAALPQSGPPPSVEGDHQRCFESMFVCTHGINITRWPLHGFGQHVTHAYRDHLPPEVQQLVGSRSNVATGDPVAAGDQQSSRAGGSGRVSGSSAAGDSGAATELKVVFQKRPGDSRQLLNMEELLEGCNAWHHVTATGRQLSAKCWEVEITDLVSGMAAALQADVFVGMHGANLANAWLMRPGSSMVEVQPYGFDAHVPHLQDPLFNAQDRETGVLWWVLMGCDPGAWQPSPTEATGKGVQANWAKNRNMVLRWEALEQALGQVAETGGSMQRYWELWDRGEWWWHVGPENVTYGGHHRSRCAQ